MNMESKPKRESATYRKRRSPQGHRVLLVDDELMMLRSAARYLKRMGYEVSTVVSGAEACALLERGGTFSAALVDLEMPGMDGLHLLERLQELRPAMAKGLWSASAHIDELSIEQLRHADFVVRKGPMRHMLATLDQIISRQGSTAMGLASTTPSTEPAAAGESGCGGGDLEAPIPRTTSGQKRRLPAESGWVIRAEILEEIAKATG